MLQKLLVDVIPEVLEDFSGVFLTVFNLLLNGTVVIVNPFHTILSLFPELLLLVDDINFVFFLPFFYFVDFSLEPLKVLLDVSVDRLKVGFHILYRGLELLEILFELALQLMLLIMHLSQIVFE